MSPSPELISVIAIFYNSADFCQKCIESILNQTGVELELIAVDDASSDKTKEIISFYARADKRVKPVFHKTNRGISGARNSGLEHINGDCFYFIDGDDHLADEKSLATLAAHCTADIDYVAASYQFIDENGNILRKRILPTGEFHNNYEIKKNFQHVDNVYIHNRLFSKRFADVRFPEKTIHEDRFFCLDIFPRLRHIIQLPDITYNYFSRSNSFSSTARFGEKYILDAEKLLDKMLSTDPCFREAACHLCASLAKDMYIGHVPGATRRGFIAKIRENQLTLPDKALVGYPRFTRFVGNALRKGTPDFILITVAKIYTTVKRIFNRPF